MIFVALGLLLIGVLIGTVGMKRLGRMVASGGQWRPGAAVLSLIALMGGMVMMVRGAALEGVLLLVGGVVLMISARKRPALRGAIGPLMARREAEQVLGVEPDATPAQIEEAYRRLIRRTHPDHGGSPGLAAQLNAARNTLGKPPARRGRTTGRGAEVA